MSDDARRDELLEKLGEAFRKRREDPKRKSEDRWFETKLEKEAVSELVVSCKSEIDRCEYVSRNSKDSYSRESAAEKKALIRTVIEFLKEEEFGLFFDDIAQKPLMSAKAEEHLTTVSDAKGIGEALSNTANLPEKSEEERDVEKVGALRSLQLSSVTHNLVLPFFKVAAIQLGEQEEYVSYILTGASKNKEPEPDNADYFAMMHVESSFRLGSIKKHKPNSAMIDVEERLLSGSFDKLLECVDNDVEKAKGALGKASEALDLPTLGRGGRA